MPLRAPHLHTALRSFCLGSFAFFGRELADGADIQFVFEEHGSRDRPTLYEYRPLVRAFVDARGGRLLALDDTAIALEALGREPAAAIYARAHAAAQAEHALFRTVLLPLVGDVAQACGGFDWDDAAFERSYIELESSLYGDRRSYAALAPVVGLTAGGTTELGRGVRVRPAAANELTAAWPDAGRLLPRDWGREIDRTLVLELEAELDSQACRVPDAPGEFGRAVSALRLATPGAIAAGPVVFERLDFRPYGVRPMPATAAQVPPGQGTRLDVFRAPLVVELQTRLADAPDDLLEALDRWELALFHAGAHRSDELREALEALLGCDEGPWAAAMRAAVLLGETAREREDLLIALRALLDGDGAGARAEDAVRRALIETLLEGSREELVATLDEALLGLRPRPQVSTSSRVLAAG